MGEIHFAYNTKIRCKQLKQEKGVEEMKEKLSRKAWTFLAVVLAVVALIPALFIQMENYGNPYDRYIVEKKVETHLTKSGYQSADLNIFSDYDKEEVLPGNYHSWKYSVVFKEEPDRLYHFAVEKDGKKVVQFCETTTMEKNGEFGTLTLDKGEHSEANCKRLTKQ